MLSFFLFRLSFLFASILSSFCLCFVFLLFSSFFLFRFCFVCLLLFCSVSFDPCLSVCLSVCLPICFPIPLTMAQGTACNPLIRALRELCRKRPSETSNPHAIPVTWQRGVSMVKLYPLTNCDQHQGGLTRPRNN